MLNFLNSFSFIILQFLFWKTSMFMTFYLCFQRSNSYLDIKNDLKFKPQYKFHQWRTNKFRVYLSCLAENFQKWSHHDGLYSNISILKMGFDSNINLQSELNHLSFFTKKQELIGGVTYVGNLTSNLQFQYYIKSMNHVLNNDQKNIPKFISSLSAGAIASFVTQPFEVMKTNMIASSSNYIRQIHNSIVQKGWSQYMRGGSLAVVRQAYGFTIYTHLISQFNTKIQSDMPLMNKFFKYSMSAVFAKYIAMIFEAPLTLMKTRLEANPFSSFRKEVKVILENPVKQIKKGIGSTLARQGFYSLFHYNTYRLLKDDILLNQFGIQSAFIPAFFAGVVAITISQPFEVIRSKVALAKNTVSISNLFVDVWRVNGWRSFFIGYLPRLLRKPINSGICWTIMENVKKLD